jgi:thiol-disulfide isomerase/thioredoxin
MNGDRQMEMGARSTERRLATRGAGTHPELAAKATSQSTPRDGWPKNTAWADDPALAGSLEAMRRLVFAVIGLGLVAVVVIGLTQSKGDNGKPHSSTISAAAAQEQLAGSPAPLAALHAQANQLLGGGNDAFQARMKQLKGHPVVVNGWAAWCGPCRAEFPYLQELSVTDGKRVAFLGLDSEDNHGDALKFLKQFPVSYPSYELPRIPTKDFGAIRGLPFMLFYDRSGELQYIHQGGYASKEQLASDIERYAVKADA